MGRRRKCLAAKQALGSYQAPASRRVQGFHNPKGSVALKCSLTSATCTATTLHSLAAAAAAAQSLVSILAQAPLTPLLRSRPPPPPPCCWRSCCAAAQKFNDGRCNCNPQVRELAKSFVGGDAGIYSRVTDALARGCGYALIC